MARLASTPFWLALATLLAAAAAYAEAPRAGAPTGTAPVEADHVDTVRMIAAYYSPATGPYFENMAASFHALHPDIEVKIEVVAWDDLQQRLRSDMASGSNADLSIVGTRWLPDLVRDRRAEPLDAMVDDTFRHRFIGDFLSPAQVDGHLYGLPIAASARAMFYNKALLAKAGIASPPATWDELLADGEKLKAAGITAFGLQGKLTETDVYWYYALWTGGGEVVDADHRARFASPAGIRSLNLYRTLIDKGYTEADVANYSREDLQTLFKQGRIAMVITAPFLIAQLAAEAPDLPYGVAAVPRGSRAATYAVTDSVVLFRNSRVKPAAFKFLDYLFTRAPRVAFTHGEGFLPTTTEEAADPVFAQDERLKVFVDQLPSAHFVPTLRGWDDAAKAVSDALQSVYAGRATPEVALGAAAEAVDQALGGEAPGNQTSRTQAAGAANSAK